MPMPASLRTVLFTLFITYASTVAHAKSVIVFAEHRPIAMTNNEHPPKDIYINAGSIDGLKVGEILSIQRQQTLYDTYNNKALNNLVFTVGKIRLIHVQHHLSVGRVVALANYENSPAVDYDSIMIGDHVDLSTGHMGSAKTAAISNPKVQKSVLATAIASLQAKTRAKRAKIKGPKSTSPTVADAKATVPIAP